MAILHTLIKWVQNHPFTWLINLSFEAKDTGQAVLFRSETWQWWWKMSAYSWFQEVSHN